MNISIDLTHTGISENAVISRREDAQAAYAKLRSGELDFTGWDKDPLSWDEDNSERKKILNASRRICSMCDYFLVLGVGGSFMGAKAVIDLLAPSTHHTKVIFAGYNFSARYIEEILDTIEGKDLCLCVVSKSGSTTETLSAYGIFNEWMLEKYGPQETAARTFVVTEQRSNVLYDKAVEEGCELFYLPEDIGGRYSVLTSVGLLPIAVSGIDIDELMAGAVELASKESALSKSEAALNEDYFDYAIVRQALREAEKKIEVFEFFDPYFNYFGEWLKQLFGESEGKDGIGLFPASLMFSRDLHSMGQFLQQGTPCFFETFVTVDQPVCDVNIPQSGFAPFAGKTLEQINDCARLGVFDAHVKAGIPVIAISIPVLNCRNLGELIYFFETQCAVSALLSGVNPFNQPGVEDYKREMRSYISRL